jgi:hypothetical protein
MKPSFTNIELKKASNGRRPAMEEDLNYKN